MVPLVSAEMLQEISFLMDFAIFILKDLFSYWKRGVIGGVVGETE